MIFILIIIYDCTTQLFLLLSHKKITLIYKYFFFLLLIQKVTVQKQLKKQEISQIYFLKFKNENNYQKIKYFLKLNVLLIFFTF